MSRNRLLVVEDDTSFRNALVSSMTSRGFDVAPAPNGIAGLAWLDQNECDLLLLDLKLPDMSGMEVLKQVRSKYPQIEVIVLTGHGTIDTAVDAIHMGAFHFLTKPCPPDEVELTLKRAQERMELVERASALQEALAPPDVGEQFVGRSQQHQEIMRLVDRVAETDSSVLIRGETGVGKELVAKLVHNRSPRRDKPFVVVDCANFHENLLQSELFGHEQGAYTGASRRKHGLFEVADQGTIFLDEVGEISPNLQVKLLRVLETNAFRPLGGTKEITVDFRVVVATNRDLAELVAKGLFREDLFYRLNTIQIEIPPLRDRPDDVACLVAHFVNRFNKRFGQEKRFSPEALDVLMEHALPGNVRQLLHIVEQAVVLSDQPIIMPEHLPREVRPDDDDSGSSGGFRTKIIPLDQVEKHYIEFVVRQLGGHRAKAASALGIGERSLYRKLKQWGIE